MRRRRHRLSNDSLFDRVFLGVCLFFGLEKRTHEEFPNKHSIEQACMARKVRVRTEKR